MVRQKDIHLKLAYTILDELDIEAEVSGAPRNRIINAAIKTYIALKDCERQCKTLPPQDARDAAFDAIAWAFPGILDTLTH